MNYPRPINTSYSLTVFTLLERVAFFSLPYIYLLIYLYSYIYIYNIPCIYLSMNIKYIYVIMIRLKLLKIFATNSDFLNFHKYISYIATQWRRLLTFWTINHVKSNINSFHNQVANIEWLENLRLFLWRKMNCNLYLVNK